MSAQGVFSLFDSEEELLKSWKEEPGPRSTKTRFGRRYRDRKQRSPGAVPAYPARLGEGNMQFVDRFLKCSDCNVDFVFTAGEQLFFNDKQFKNDPKRCKLCKAKRAGLGRSANPNAVAALPFSRTETRTECSACGIETTVPFKPTQGRPVLCRSCFQLKRVPSGVAAVANMDSPAAQVAAVSAALDEAMAAETMSAASSSAATMEMISEVPAAMLVESDSPTGIVAAPEFADSAQA